MSDIGIHIVSFDVPYPFDYGGVIDVYHRCKYLKKAGAKVILHCFEYGRGKPKELEEVADEVYYYKRRKSIFDLLSPLPFIVKTRSDKDLLERLLQDDYPILFEGTHTCYFLNHPKLTNRWKGVRAHNVEHDYYWELAKVENNFLKKKFFQMEARKLKNFEGVFKEANEILTVTPKDNDYYQKTYGKGQYIPVFNPLSWGNTERKAENYALFHGNLSVKENEHAVRYIVDQIWENKFPLKLKIAGKDPSEAFVKYLESAPFSIEVISSPSNEDLNKLIRNAKINLLPTFQNTGIKHKLLNCLSNGGFCLANTPMVEGTGLESFCHIADSNEEWKAMIIQLASTEENEEEIKNRQAKIHNLFDCEVNAKRILELSQK